MAKTPHWSDFYTVKPIEKEVTRKEFQEFISNYPRELIVHDATVCTPICTQYLDKELAPTLFKSQVARTYEDYDGTEYPCVILENYEEVYNSKRFDWDINDYIKEPPKKDPCEDYMF